jgi:hypothetical protein
LDAGSNVGDSFHIDSHAALLPQPPRGAGVAQRAVDALVVPTIRPDSVEPAADLARDLGCPLVVLCSTPDQAERALLRCEPSAGRMLVTHVPPSLDEDDGLLSFLTSVHPENDIERSCHVDIARKRNVGLLLARLCGWRTIMYLDDDIRDLAADAIARAASLTERFPAVGFQISDYPDNSVVCHAYRLTGGNQGTFPGGSALLVDTTRYDALFPPIYNEDWLFLFDAVRDRSVTVAGTLSQLEYQPFAHSRRAASEEFGDVIAEGLYRLLHEGSDVTGATYAYWQGVLEQRSRLIDHIATRLLRDAGTPVTGAALMALAAARKRLTAITALACVSFVHAWRTDREVWRHRLLGLDVLGDLADAAKYLNLPTVDRCVNSERL